MLLLLSLLLFLLIAPSPSPAAPPSHEEQYRVIQQRMAEQKKKLKDAQERESSILEEMQDVNMRLAAVETELGKYRKRMRRTESEMRSVSAEIEKTKAILQKQKDWLKRKLRTMHRFGYSSETLVLLMSSGDISRMMRTWKYLEQITLYENKIIGDYRENLRGYSERRERLQDLKAQLRDEAERIRAKEVELAAQRQEKETILATVREEKTSRSRMLAELREASRKLRELIEQASKSDTYTAAGTAFSRLRGKLPWPVSGRIVIPYGAQRDPQYNTPVFRTGVHIETAPDSEAKAVHEGKVIFAEWFKGFGQLVIVNHGNGYHTLYGNLSEIFSHVGDIIKEHQVIGKVGTSGITNSPGLYFEIRYKGKPLDPAQWLRHGRG